ncbi:bifunctional DNA-formamidopyrimidine glycosylase/DNA-(apurinic or apyrimidinic site) lyase [Candidatus Amesbacteria bacterium]|nr:bifunctional DNA-formamidopyrimidine glycosylase/DNA-(apurinic or apyrimidinic site) lyase [Candidatus Amesbacteria bacterium]
MPELPEIETVKLQLQKVLVGQKLLSVSDEKYKSLKYKSVKEIRREGKVFLINFGPNLDLGFHFKMTGQLVYGGLPTKHTRAIFEFTKGTLYFNDMRKFGWVKINPEFTKTLGEDALDISTHKFLKLLKELRKPIKIAIMDQKIIAGVGNIYANDALWESAVNPRTPVNQLSINQLTNLLKKIKLVLREGIKYGGTSLSDYVDAFGKNGSYQDHIRVYKKHGEKCKRCKSIIKRIVLGGRGTYYCPKCQI